jgi:FkbM family methyltransferase
MNPAVRRFFQHTPVLRGIYLKARGVYHNRRTRNAAKSYFVNFAQFEEALKTDDGKLVEIRTKNGLALTIRQNCMDAGILVEVFLDNSYVQGLSLPAAPVVVDIGGYIGDFAIYAAKVLGAQKVVVCEPSPRNWSLLTKNVANNHFEDRIVMVNKAVGDGEPLLMNIDAPDRGQARVTAYGPASEQRKPVPGTTLAQVVQENGLGTIDLLKIDCEGGEYTILGTAPDELLARVRNIVFEYHEIPGFEPQLQAVRQRLGSEGFNVRTHGDLVFASRA